ncbi:aryl-sulfate sulfotransferase [Anaerolentibacter hominis]|uniref:aryl-sulfate sulfotransferase n=1 Tax=Anaerolentibacter hominis TaxID=3079009 RepID=UPI0031B8373D
MKKSIWILLTVLLLFTLAGCSKKEVSDQEDQNTPIDTDDKQEEPDRLTPDFSDYLEEQRSVDENLLKEADKGYTLDNPLVVVNPYGTSPLTAIAIFNTDTEQSVTVTVKGKKEKDNIEHTFDAASTHILPIYGLYAGGSTEVEFVLEDGTSKTVSVETDALNTNLVKAEIKKIDKDQYDYSKLTFACAMMDASGYTGVAYDSEGDIRWALSNTIAMPLKRLANGHLMISSSRVLKTQYYTTGLYEIDLSGKVYNDYLVPGGQHHDFWELPNGNLLVCSDARDFSTVEAHVVEIDRATGEVVDEIDLSKLLNPKDGGSINRTDEDWFHNNAVCYDEKTDTILLSGRHVDAVVGINRSSKEVSWILGDPDGWEDADPSLFFTPEGKDFEWQYAQHEATMLPNGDILLFDNGAGRTKVGKEDQKVTGSDVYSRAVIYRIDTDKMTIRQVWEYGKDRGEEWYSSFISGAQYLGEDNIWVTSGGISYNPETKSYDSQAGQGFGTNEFSTYINQVKDGKVVFEMKINNWCYRSYHMDMYSDEGILDLTQEGKYLGDLGETPAIDAGSFDASKAVPADFEFTVTQSPDRLAVSGSWSGTGDDARMVLLSEDGTAKAYAIPAPAFAGEEGAPVAFTAWTSPVSLDGSWNLYLVNNGTIYDTNYQVTFETTDAN